MSPSRLPSLLRIQAVHRKLRQLQSCLSLCFPKGLYFLAAITTPHQTNSFTQEPILSPPKSACSSLYSSIINQLSSVLSESQQLSSL